MLAIFIKTLKHSNAKTVMLHEMSKKHKHKHLYIVYVRVEFFFTMENR